MADHKSRHPVLRVGWWLVPIVIIAVVLLKVDLGGVKREFARVNLWFVLLALAVRVIVVTVGGLRWWVLLRRTGNSSLRVADAVRHYWIGLAVGMFAPSQVGWDVYRAAVVRRASGQWREGVAVLGSEKGIAVISAALMVVCLSAVTARWVVTDSKVLDVVILTARASLGIGILVSFAVYLLFRSRLGGRVWMRLRSGVMAIARKAGRRSAAEVDENSRGELAFTLERLLDPATLVEALGLSILILALAAASSHLGFQAVGYRIPYLVNLFLAPVFFFVLLLPISFGGIGVRDVAFIVLFGLFGVPAETALVVSALSLAGLLLSMAIGALLIYGTRSGTWHASPALRNRPDET